MDHASRLDEDFPSARSRSADTGSNGLVQMVEDAAKRLFRSASGLVGDLMDSDREPVGDPRPPTAPASPAPTRAPSEAPPGGNTSTGGGSQNDGPIYAVLSDREVFSILLQGGKAGWPSLISLKPDSGWLSVAERPG